MRPGQVVGEVDDHDAAVPRDTPEHFGAGTACRLEPCLQALDAPEDERPDGQQVPGQARHGGEDGMGVSIRPSKNCGKTDNQYSEAVIRVAQRKAMNAAYSSGAVDPALNYFFDLRLDSLLLVCAKLSSTNCSEN